MKRCESKRKTFKTKRGRKVTFLASVGETCVPKYDRPSALQQKWRRNFTRVAKSCPAKPGAARTACMKRGLDVRKHGAEAGMAGYHRRHHRRAR